MNVKIGDCELKGKPGVVASVDRLLDREQAETLPEMGADIIEMRYDLFKNSFDETLEFTENLSEWTKLPMIGTLRPAENNRGRREEMFKRIVPLVDCIDAEKEVEKIFSAAREIKDITLIYSTHDFEKTPDRDGFNIILDRGKKLGADIVKIAVTPSDKNDVARLLEYTKETGTPLVTISMGKTGGISRIAAPLFGSLLTYGYVREAVAPGQFHFSELASFVKRFY